MARPTAGCQLAPPSVETSTAPTIPPPASAAVPLMVVGLPGCTTSPAVGDPIEAHALAEALCKERPADSPLPIGSVKTNLGHLETAAGVAGLVKAALVLKHREIPGVMRAMTMPFHVDARVLPVLKRDQELLGRIEKRGKEWWLFNIKLLGAELR